MPATRPRRPSPALVLASIALFVSLSGVSYAALQLDRASVKSRHVASSAIKHRHIAKNAVRGSELRRNAVSSSDVADGTLQAEDFGTDVLPAPLYVGYLQPRAATRSIDVGWGTSSDDAPTLVYDAPGRYNVQFGRAVWRGCAVPTATAFTAAAGVTLRVIGLECTAATTSFTLQTSNGQDAQFMLQVGFSD